jgi:AcrR family transcriptional regulator
VGGVSLDALAAQFGCHRDAIWRHFRNHVTAARKSELLAGPARIEGLATQAADESRSLLDYFRIARSVLFSQFLAAAEAGDRNGVANIASKLLDSLKEVGKLTGELRQLSGITVNNNTGNFVATPEFGALTQGLLAIARAHPESKGDIISLLRSLDDGPASPKPNGAGHHLLIEGEVARAPADLVLAETLQ